MKDLFSDIILDYNNNSLMDLVLTYLSIKFKIFRSVLEQTLVLSSYDTLDNNIRGSLNFRHK